MESGNLSAKMEPSGPVYIGTRNIEVRQLPVVPCNIISEIIEYVSPRRISAQGLNGTIRARIGITVELLENNTRSLVTKELEVDIN